MNKFARKRKRMWLKNSHCENCGIPTVLPEDIPGIFTNKGLKKFKNIPNNMATIQHKYGRLSHMRKILTGERRLFLWCTKCNDEDNEKEQSLLTLEERQQLSGHVISDDIEKIKNEVRNKILNKKIFDQQLIDNLVNENSNIDQEVANKFAIWWIKYKYSNECNLDSFFKTTLMEKYLHWFENIYEIENQNN